MPARLMPSLFLFGKTGGVRKKSIAAPYPPT